MGIWFLPFLSAPPKTWPVTQLPGPLPSVGKWLGTEAPSGVDMGALLVWQGITKRCSKSLMVPLIRGGCLSKAAVLYAAFSPSSIPFCLCPGQ